MQMAPSFIGPTDPPEYSWLYAVPAVVFTGGFLAAASTGMAGLVQAGYLTSSVLCIGSLSGLGSQTTARQGNALGILGVGSGVLASLGAVGFSPEVVAQFAGVAAIGGLVGSVIGRRVTATELPQTVALLHSIVGLSAVLTSIGSVLQESAHLSNLHLVTAYLGVVIGLCAFLSFSRLSSLKLSFLNRWDYVHGLYCCFSEAGCTNDNQAPRPSREAPDQYVSSGCKCYDHGRVHGHDSNNPFDRSFFPWCQHNSKFLEGVYYHRCYRWCRHASVVFYLPFFSPVS